MCKRATILTIGVLVTLIVIALSYFTSKAWRPLAKRFPADTHKTDTTVNASNLKKGHLLSAFFGLDNGLPLGASRGICPKARRADGMPIVFAQEVDASTVQSGDFQVVKQSSKVGDIFCVTMIPAVDPGELRTVLLIGEFGSARTDPPVTVEIVGNLLSKDRRTNFKTAKIAVVPLLNGPRLVLAEVVPRAQWKLGKVGGSRGNGSGCPQGTVQAVRAVWDGGVNEVKGNTKFLPYQLKLEQKNGSYQTVTPFALADLGDGDNNHLLCLNIPGTPRLVTFAGGYLVDPNQDLNTDTSIAISH